MASSTISSVMATTSTSSTVATTTSSDNSVDSDDFMTLLLAQLKNQDPMNPMDSNEMMAQLATLQSLNAMIEMQTTLEEIKETQQMSYAASLIGKTITAIPDENDTSSILTGVVTSMVTEDGNTTVQVDGYDIELSSIVAIEGSTTEETTETE